MCKCVWQPAQLHSHASMAIFLGAVRTSVGMVRQPWQPSRLSCPEPFRDFASRCECVDDPGIQTPHDATWHPSLVIEALFTTLALIFCYLPLTEIFYQGPNFYSLSIIRFATLQRTLRYLKCSARPESCTESSPANSFKISTDSSLYAAAWQWVATHPS